MRTLIYVFFAGMLLACGGSKQKQGITGPPEQSLVSASDLPSDFNAFYSQFHRDSLYQMAHITWPLQGETGEPVDSTHFKRVLMLWDSTHWRMHHPIDFSTGEFEQQFEMMGAEMVIEKIRYKSANYGLERRFLKNDKAEWELIYYSDLQQQ